MCNVLLPHVTVVPRNEENMEGSCSSLLSPKHDNLNFFVLTGAKFDASKLDSKNTLFSP